MGSDSFGHFNRQAGLSRAADPANSHNTRIIEAGRQGSTFAITADEAGQERRQRITKQLPIHSQDKSVSEWTPYSLAQIGAPRGRAWLHRTEYTRGRVGQVAR